MRLIRLFIVFSLLFLPGCSKQKTRSLVSEDKFLRLSFHTEVRSLDPRVGIDYPSAYAIKMLFEGLMRIGMDGKPQYAIADSYELTDNHKTYTFHLKPTHWSNGDKLTAHDFIYAWKQVIDPNYGSSLGVQNFYPILNVPDIVAGKKPLDTAGIRALDDETIEIRLTYPTPYFLEVLATSAFFPVNAKVDKSQPGWANQEGGAFVCNGPFTLNRHRLENEIVVQKNPRYWDEQSVRLPGIRIDIIKDSTTQLSLFEKNKLEWLGKPLSKIPIDAVHHLRSKNQVHFFETLGLYWYFINTESFPFNNRNMRLAFAYAIDREAITSHITQGEETPAMGVLPHTLATQDAPFFEDNNRKEALRLFQLALSELGISKEELPPITINYASGGTHSRVTEALQEQWNEVFDLNIQIENQEWKSHYGKLQSGNFQIGGMLWQSWLRDPIYILQTFRGKSASINMSRWDNPDYLSYLDAAEQEYDAGRRKALFNKAESLLMAEMPVIPVYFNTIAYGKSDRLKNVYISELYEVDFRWAYLEE